MDAVKNKLNSMKAQSELSEERIIKFESNLTVSKQHLEAALKEKESLYRKIEAIEAQILLAERKKEDVVDKLKGLRDDTDCSESKRRVLENRELEGDVALGKLEDRLRTVREKYGENATQCEEGERRLYVLTADFEKTRERRLKSETTAEKLEKEIEAKMAQLRCCEESLRKNSYSDFKQEDHIKLLESYHREAEEKKELGRLNILKLRRQIENTEDEIENVRMRTKEANVQLKNIVHAVVNV